MVQRSLPGITPIPPDRIINVASVKHRSPFRYPGGKTWLVPRIFQWIDSLAGKPRLLIEPFAGGAIVGLTAAFEKLAEHVILVEMDHQIAAVWETIITKNDGPWLADQIVNFDLTAVNVERILQGEGLDIREAALQTIVKNRVNRGGILAEGAGKLKFGENGKGLGSRWYPATLQKRIQDIAAIADRLSFIQSDGLNVMSQYTHRPDVVYFIDPPYTASGKKPGSRLYTHWEIDHQRLFKLTSELKGDFLMTYDNVDEIREMAAQYGFETLAVCMKNTHHAQLTELLIGRDLNWIRR